MSRFWLIPLLVALFVIGPFLIWGEALEALLTPDPETGDYPGGRDWLWLVAIGLLIADIVIPIPTTSIIAALGIVYGPIAGAVAAIIGSMLAAVIGYAIGRFLGRPVARGLIGDAMERGERVFGAYGGWIVAASRWMPVLPEVISVVAGVSRMRFLSFALAAFCGVAPFCVIFATFGHYGASQPVVTLVVSALVPLALWWIASRLGWTRRLRIED